MKAVASILFAFLLLWHPSTSEAGGACGGDMTITCASCCCAARDASVPSIPLGPVQSRSAETEQLTLLLPTVSASFSLEQSAQVLIPPQAELCYSVAAVPLFRRDCALLL